MSGKIGNMDVTFPTTPDGDFVITVDRDEYAAIFAAVKTIDDLADPGMMSQRAYLLLRTLRRQFDKEINVRLSTNRSNKKQS